MLTVGSLVVKIEDLRVGNLSLDDFEDWFRDNSRGAYADAQLGGICADIEAIFSEYYSADISEIQVRKEMANAIHPFENRNTTRWVARLPVESEMIYWGNTNASRLTFGISGQNRAVEARV